MGVSEIISFIIGAGVCSVAFFFVYQKLKADLGSKDSELAALRTESQFLRQNIEDQKVILGLAEEKFKDSFKALSADALEQSSKNFMRLAEQVFTNHKQNAVTDLDKRQTAISELIKPMKESLTKMDEQIQMMEKSRAGAYEGLKQQVVSLMNSQNQLRGETQNLVKALRSPVTRGRWGEIQLKRVVELAGMIDHCDFYEQISVQDQNAPGKLRPDMTIRLPGKKIIIVDAKTPLEGYLTSIETENEGEQKENLIRHARHIREHMKMLGSKAYWAQFEDTPEFVVMFLPGENFFSSALEVDPGLIEAGMEHGVILATPTTLIALLRAVAYGWRQESLTENARLISVVGAELYKRLTDMGANVTSLGTQLSRSVETYNKMVGNLESRVMVSARKLYDLKVSSDVGLNEEIPKIEKTTRDLRLEEFVKLEQIEAA